MRDVSDIVDDIIARTANKFGGDFGLLEDEGDLDSIREDLLKELQDIQVKAWKYEDLSE